MFATGGNAETGKALEWSPRPPTARGSFAGWRDRWGRREWDLVALGTTHLCRRWALLESSRTIHLPAMEGHRSMSGTLTWLHLSDLHAGMPPGWDSKRVTDTLRADLRKMRDKHGLHPDLIFFTGDSAFGQIGKKRGEFIGDQFREAHDFLTTVREIYEPSIPQRNLFLIPGNHDVNRERISRFESQWLEQTDSLAEIEQVAHQAGTDWRRLIARLDDYATFLEACGYEHLLTGREHLIYADAREVAGVRVGIAGFNSAWSSRGAGREESGRLWMAGRFQLETLLEEMPPHDLAIALVHHPANWLVPEEGSRFGRQLERDFPFVLHGHEHQDFVRPDAGTGHTVVSAGACHEWSEGKNNGYNFVRLDLVKGSGEVWLREYESTGGGWRPRVISDRTDDRGRWTLSHLQPWMDRLVRSRAGAEIATADSTTAVVTEEDSGASDVSDVSVDRAADYEARYRKAVADRLDYVQIFGIEVPREAKEYSLTVAYVSLDLTDEDEEDRVAESCDEPEFEGPTSLTAEEVFDGLGTGKGRLLIRGAAGCGKTTLLRWAAVQAGKQHGNIDTVDDPTKPAADRPLNKPGPMADDTMPALGEDWRKKVPFVIRLRDCPGGQLPRPSDLPFLLAKELPDPPPEWMDDVLSSGRGLIMFDGADEVPPTARAELLREIRQLMRTHPDNYYVVTTRPAAVERVEFRELGFISARIEPMAPHNRDTFIGRWHDAMEVRLRNWNEPADLRPLAERLMQRLGETPAIARLTVNPLLCAVVCALHRERNENLPETPVELCEKLCEMLLLRRDKERPGLEAQKFVDEAYRRLEFRVRKGLLSKLAHYMVLAGVSAIQESEADEQIDEALKSYKFSDVSPVAVRRALVERSGMLQESSGQRIEFLHNTLKEFLAAERFVNSRDFQTMADNAAEASWQPVILFAVALPRDGSTFATDLVGAILEQTPRDAPSPGYFKESRKEAARQRERQFFFFQCCASAYQLDEPAVIEARDQIAEHLLPPTTMTDAEGLATCGETVIKHLENRDGMYALHRAACVRTLRLIGGPRARRSIETYFGEATQTVLKELAKLGYALAVPALLQIVQRSKNLPKWLGNGLSDLTPLASRVKIKSLVLGPSHVSDLAPLASMRNLRSLDLSNTAVSDISPLESLNKLTFLNLLNTKTSDVSAVASMTGLTSLNLLRTRISNVAPLASLSELKSLDLSYTNVSDITSIASLTKLTSLGLLRTRISDATPLASLANLTSLDLSHTNVTDITPLASLVNLTSLDLSHTKVGDITPLAPLVNLTSLDLSHTKVGDITPLAPLVNLTSLDLSHTKARDITPLASLADLTSLTLSHTEVSDITSLASLFNLTSLDLSRTKVSDIATLSSLVNLTSLDFSRTKVSDITTLSSLVNLKSLRFWSTKISDIAPLVALTRLSRLALSRTNVSDIMPLASMPRIWFLNIQGTKVSDTSVAEFEKAKPGCTVYR